MPVVRYQAPWPVYALAWSSRADRPFRLAMGSFLEEYRNQIHVVSLPRDETPETHDSSKKQQGDFQLVAQEDHHYPMTKCLWMPQTTSQQSQPDLLATSGDFLRIWEWQAAEDGDAQGKLVRKALLTNTKNADYCAPITSFDWNETDPRIMGTASIDTTCTIWDVQTQQVKTQLIAHDKEVYDMGFTSGTDVFASVGADGSVRMFDLRNLEHSTIIYETPDATPLLRLQWNKQDHNYLATFQMDSHKIIILDVRVPSVPVTELHGHTAAVNACSWAPHSASHICTVGDDSQALVWDLNQMRKSVKDPILCYSSQQEINQIHWNKHLTDWVAIASGSVVEALHI